MITLHNLSNSNEFFRVVDSCGGPVTIRTQDGRAEDIRSNLLIQNLLSECSGGGCIQKLELHVQNTQDLKNIFRFMLQNKVS